MDFIFLWFLLSNQFKFVEVLVQCRTEITHISLKFCANLRSFKICSPSIHQSIIKYVTVEYTQISFFNSSLPV